MRTILLIAVLLLPRMASADWVYPLSKYTVAVAHGMDLASTQRCLGAGTCHELNHYLARFNDPILFTLAKGAVASLGVWAADQIPNKRVAAVVNYSITGAFSAIAIRNYRLTRPKV